MVNLFDCLKRVYNAYPDSIPMTNPEVDKIVHFIQSRVKLNINTFYSSKQTGLARSIQVDQRGRSYILLNKKRDPQLGEGGVKKVKMAVLTQDGSLYATA